MKKIFDLILNMPKKISDTIKDKLNRRISLISIIVAGVFSICTIIVSIYINKSQIENSNTQISTQLKQSTLGLFSQRLDNINAEQMTYPFLEDSIFIASQNSIRIPKNDSSLRYIMYCERVFNFLQDLTEYYQYNKNDIEKFVDIEYFVQQHKDWIKEQEKDKDINKAYPKKYLDFLNSYMY